MGPKLVQPPVRRWLRQPKHLLLVVLVALAALDAGSATAALAARSLAAAVVTACAIDTLILRVRHRAWCFSSGALLTGLLVAMILGRQVAPGVSALAAALAIGSKYIIRGRTANVFNPAALALVLVFDLLHAPEDWWGAIPAEPDALLLLLAAGMLVTARVTRAPAVLSFLGSYFLLFTGAALMSAPSDVAEIFRVPDVCAALFCAFFMVTDPPTSPTKTRYQLIFGAIAAAASFVLFETAGTANFLLVGLLVANGWEGWRRLRRPHQNTSGPALPAPLAAS